MASNMTLEEFVSALDRMVNKHPEPLQDNGIEPEDAWRACAALRAFPKMLSALEAVQRSDRLGASASEHQEARDLWTDALRAAREAVKP